MLNKFNTSTKLYLLVIILSFFIIEIGVYGIGEMRKLEQNAQTLYADRVLPLQQLADIRYSYATGILSSLEQVQSSQLSFSNSLKQIQQAQKTISTNWKAYEQTYMTTEENSIASQVSLLINHSNEPIERVKIILKKEDARGVDAIIKNELYPALNPVIAKVSDLINLQVRVSSEVYANSIEVYNSSLKKFILVILLSLLIAIPFSFVLVRNIKNLIRELLESNIKIKHAEEKHRALTDNLKDAILLVNAKGERTYQNSAASRILGYTLEEKKDKTLVELVHPDDVPIISGAFKTVSSSPGVLFQKQFRVQHKNGQYIWIEGGLINQLDNESINSYILYYRDITELKLAEEAKLETEEKFRFAFMNSLDAMSISSLPDGRFLEVNSNFYKFFGLSPEEIIGKTSGEAAIYEDPMVREKVYASIAEKGYASNFEFNCKNKSGELFTLLFSANTFQMNNKQYLMGVGRDITEQKKAEDALKIAAVRQQAIAQTSLDGFYVTDLEMRLLEVNPTYCRMSGYSEKELLTMKIEQLNITLTPEIKSQLIKETIQKGNNRFEAQHRKKDGTIYDVEISITYLGAEGGKFMSFIKDITERKQAEKVLKISEERLRIILESMPILLDAFDEEGNILVWNKACEEATGYRADEIIGNPKALELLYPDAEYRREVMSGSIDSENIHNEFELRAKDGKVKTIQWFDIYHQLDIPGWASWGLGLDITQRKQAEKSLQESEEKHRALTENISDAVMLINKSAEVIYNSPSAERLSGYSLADTKGKNVYEFIHPNDLQSSIDFFRLSGKNPGVPLQTEFRVLHKQGHYFWAEGTIINLLHNDSVKGFIVNYRDITERKKATELFEYQFKNSPDIIMVINPDYKIEVMNRSLPGGTPVKDLVGRDCIEVLPEESRQINKDAIIRCFETEKNQEIESEVRLGIFVRARFVPIISDGIVSHIMIISTDITESKQATLQLKKSEERHRAITENISEAIILINENEEAIYQSPSVERIAGFTSEDMKEKKVYEFVYPNDVNIARDIFQSSFLNPGIPISSQFRARHKNGHYIWIEGTIMNLLNNESVKAFVLNYRNITERKKAEQVIKDTSAHLQLATRSANIGIFDWDIPNDILKWDEKMHEIYGGSADKFDGLQETWSNALHPDDLQKTLAEVQSAIEGKKDYHTLFRILRSNQEIRYVEGDAIILRDEEGNALRMIGVNRDVTHRVKFETDLKKIIEEKELLLKEVHHRVKNNLQIISGLLLLQINKISDPEILAPLMQSRDRIETISLVHEKLYQSESISQISFKMYLEELIAMLKHTYSTKAIQMELNIPELYLNIETAVPLGLIFHELISNSMKHAFSNESLNNKINILLEILEKDRINIQYSDNGMGADIDRINKSNSLGMKLINGLVKQLNGELTIESGAGKGALFNIKVSRKDA